MANPRSRWTLVLGLAVLGVLVLLLVLVLRPRAARQRSDQDRAEATRPTSRRSPADRDATRRRREMAPPTAPGALDRSQWSAERREAEGEDRPNEGPLPGEDLPPPPVPSTPPEKQMIETKDVTPEFRAEKTAKMITHLSDRARRLGEEIQQLERSGSGASAELQRKRHFLTRLQARQRKLEESLKPGAPASPAENAPREPGAGDPAGAEEDEALDEPAP